MIDETLVAILLAIPLITLAAQSIRYWSEFRSSQSSVRPVRKADYRKPYFYLLVFGVLCMWLAWLGAILFSLLHAYHSVFEFLTFSSQSALAIQIVGFIIFYLGVAIYNLTLLVAGKHLRPAPSGMHEEHKLVTNGPFRLIRHPLYVSYLLIVAGLSLILLSYWLLIPALCVIAGIYPTAKAEEETLTEQFGEEYAEYKRRVSMFVPRLF